MAERLETHRHIHASPERIFSVLCDPRGHVAIDSSGMLQSATGAVVGAAGDEFVVHMDREALNDHPLGKYDVVVVITEFRRNELIEWTIRAFDRTIGHRYGYALQPDSDGTTVTSYYDWSRLPASPERDRAFPVIPEFALRATLGILARTVESSS